MRFSAPARRRIDRVVIVERKRVLVCYALALMAGAILALGAFVPVWWLQLGALLAFWPVFVLLRMVPVKHAYSAGLVFACAWLIPTTYWYYAFMPPWLAFAASFGFAALLANIFWVVLLRQRWGMRVVAPLFMLVWCGWLWARLHMPVTEDWWLPYSGYSLWRNSALIWLGGFGGEAVVEAVIVAVGIVLAWVWARRGWRASTALAVAIIAATVGGHFLVRQLPAHSASPAIAVQMMTRGGINQPATENDVDDLIEATDQALQERDTSQGAITVVWPENSIPTASESRLEKFAAEHRVRLVYHTNERQGDGDYKQAVILDQDGRRILTNYKAHIAPAEDGTDWYTDQHAVSDGQVVTAYVCYDMHYPDIVKRLRGADSAYATLDDATYGYLQKQFHAADISLHAAQAGVPVTVASTNGPTIAVDSRGVVRQQMTGSGPAVLVVDR
jgi:membrane protein